MNERGNELMKGQRSRIKLRFGSAFLLLIVVDVTFHPLAAWTSKHALYVPSSPKSTITTNRGKNGKIPKSIIVIPAVGRGNGRIVVREK